MTQSDPRIVLRPPKPEDAERLAQLAREAFDAAFAHLYKPEDLAAFHAEYKTAGKYRKAIDDPATRIQLAEVDGQLAAYSLIVLGEQFADHPNPKPKRPVMLSQLYCAREATGMGLGATLMGWVLAEAREWQADAITLSVYSENYGAQRFYQRYGFRHVADIDFWVGNHRDDEYLYELLL
jgi:ribosomal protein S18 acetylase RimI-like enzyme